MINFNRALIQETQPAEEVEQYVDSAISEACILSDNKELDKKQKLSLTQNMFETAVLWKKPVGKFSKGGEITIGTVVKSIYMANGVLSVASRALGVSRYIIQKWAGQVDAIKEAIDDARACTADFAENRLLDSIERGHPWAIETALRYRSDFNDAFLYNKELKNNKGLILSALDSILNSPVADTEEIEESAIL